MRPRILLSALILALGLLMAGPAGAQSTRELNGPDLTTDKLIDTLAPPADAGPPPQATRGLELRCTHYHEQASRGLELQPKADVVALQIEFASGSDRLTPEAEQTLDKLGEALNSEKLKPCCFEIRGHTDSIGSAQLNKKLSERRAESVIDYLSEHSNIEKDRMMAKGFGKSKPIAPNTTQQGRARNRRVEVANVGYAGGASD
jgi:OmpA-OmpF porin, OOP family